MMWDPGLLACAVGLASIVFFGEEISERLGKRRKPKKTEIAPANTVETLEPKNEELLLFLQEIAADNFSFSQKNQWIDVTVSGYPLSLSLLPLSDNSFSFLLVGKHAVIDGAVTNGAFDKIRDNSGFITANRLTSFSTAFMEALQSVQARQIPTKKRGKSLAESLNNALRTVDTPAYQLANQPNANLASLLDSFPVAFFPTLHELEKSIAYMDTYGYHLEVEANHQYARLRNQTFPNLLASFLEFSREEQVTYAPDLTNSLEEISKELQHLADLIQTKKRQSFQKQQYLVKS